MDLQSIITNQLKVDRAETMKTSQQLTVGELILLLEQVNDKARKVSFDFGYFYPIGLDSWRGSYCELAFEYSNEGDAPTVEQVLNQLRSAIGKTYEGYKGGDFVMGKTTPLWVANCGDSNSTAVIGIRDFEWIVVIDTKYIEY
jgi:hypothetical protein